MSKEVIIIPTQVIADVGNGPVNEPVIQTPESQNQLKLQGIVRNYPSLEDVLKGDWLELLQSRNTRRFVKNYGAPIYSIRIEEPEDFSIEICGASDWVADWLKHFKTFPREWIKAIKTIEDKKTIEYKSTTNYIPIDSDSPFLKIFFNLSSYGLGGYFYFDKDRVNSRRMLPISKCEGFTAYPILDKHGHPCYYANLLKKTLSEHDSNKVSVK